MSLLAHRLRRNGAGAAAYIVPAVNFDGSNDYLTASAAWAPDGKEGTLSFWLKVNTPTGLTSTIFGRSANPKFRMRMYTSGTLELRATNSSNTVILLSDGDVGVTDNVWTHIVASWDLAAGVAKIYKNGSFAANASTITNDTIDYTGGSSTGVNAIGADQTGAGKFIGDMAQFFFHDDFIDLTDAGNLSKFISVAGKPVDMGADGSTPFGAQPRVYLNNPTASWQDNLGSVALGFTENGALTDAATSPSD